jgi:hypothetical protein
MTPGDFRPELAVDKLDQCLNTIASLREIPNVALARLLLMQAAGDRVAAKNEIDNPIFTTPGSDDLTRRVQLLCRLHAADKAESLLVRVLADPTLKTSKRSDALVRRAEVRVRLGKFAEARADANEAVAAAGDDAALKAGVEMKLLKIEEGFPAYAAYVKSHSEK